MKSATTNGSGSSSDVHKLMRAQADMMQELGAPGLKIVGGFIDEEFLTDLRGRKAVRVFEEMRLNDPIVGAILFAIENLLKQVKWSITSVDESPAAIEVKDFLHGAMFDDMSTGWSDVLSEILTMIPFGWAYLEVVYKLRKGQSDDPMVRSKFNDGKVGWRKWALRGQNTLLRWDIDLEDGGINAMIQNPAPMYNIRTIPIEKALLFRTVAQRNNPEGRSLLRNSYRPWFFKKHMEEIEGIGVERDLAGYPVFKMDKEAPDIWNAKDPDALAIKARLEEIITAVKRDEQEGMLLPWWVNFELVSTGSRRAFDTNAIIARYDTRIAMTMMADFVLLGSGAHGAWALSTDKTRIFASILDGIMDNIADTINRHGIPKLLEFNNVPVELTPTLTHTRVDPENIRVLADFVSRLVPAGVIHPTPELESALMGLSGLPMPADSITAKRSRESFQKALARYKAKQGSGVS